MKQFTFSTALILSVAAIAAAETASERLTVAADVFQEIMSTPDKGIPQDLLGKSQCVIIVPGLKKGAFVVGGEYGRGFALCRKDDGFGWGAPGAVRVEGGSFGAQIGGSSTDVVMLVMNKRGMQKLLGDKFTLGADASVAAGPVGRTVDAATDVRMNAEILAWSRAKGLFAGIALNGATLRNDSEANAELYGRKIDNKAVLSGMAVEPPPAAAPLRDSLDKYSMRK
jgi:lipid-binding SYLF domain-containing protein